MSFSNYLEQALLDHMFGFASFTSLSSVFVALSSADPGEDGGSINEPSSGSYARKEITATNLTRSGSAVSNDNAEEFAESSGAWNSGSSLTHMALFDASTGGNFLGSTALDTPRTVDSSGITLRFAAGEMSVSLD